MSVSLDKGFGLEGGFSAQQAEPCKKAVGGDKSHGLEGFFIEKASKEISR